MALSSDVLSRHKQEWEELAKVDPLWAILTAPDRRGGGWELAEFFATGEAEISEMLKVADDKIMHMPSLPVRRAGRSRPRARPASRRDSDPTQQDQRGRPRPA